MTLGRIGDFDGKCPKCRIGEILDGIMAATQNKLRSIFANYDAAMREALESGGNSSITNDILECQRKGSALKVDEIKPITQINPKTRRPEIIKEFPATAQSHGFNDLIDNYAGYATKSLIRNGTLYQLKGTLNGVQGRFEWIIQDGYVTHRMFVRDGTMNGVPIKP